MVNALVLRTAGTNCDGETIQALKACGASPERLHIRQLLEDPAQLKKFALLVIPGGFSYGDDISAGRILANELKYKLGGPLREFVAAGKLAVGICNGFQVLAKTGFLPAPYGEAPEQTATLTNNDSKRFQCEWVWMKRENSRAAWLSAVPVKFQLPIAHGEGKFVARDDKTLAALEKNKQVVFRYAPQNPNGSARAIAGVCNPAGNVVGLMPHPERYITPFQHPAWTRNDQKEPTPGLLFWRAAVGRAKKVKAK